MKLFKNKKSLVALILTVALIGGVSTNATASETSINFMGILKKVVLANLPPQLTGLIEKKGDLSVGKTLEVLSKRGVDRAKKNIEKNGISGISSGQIFDGFFKDAIEISADTNQKDHANAMKEFETNLEVVDRIATQNEQPSNSSLEAADKANKLKSAIITTTQQQIAATQRLNTTEQIQNANSIREMQLAKVKDLRDQAVKGSMREDLENTRALTLNRFVPDGAGGMKKLGSGEIK